MNRRQRIIILLVGGAVLVGLFLFLRFRQPHYEGQSLDQWLVELGEVTPSENLKTVKRHSTSPTQYEAWLKDANTRHAHATKAIRAMGTNALPRLITVLHAKESPSTTALRRLAEKQSLFTPSFHDPSSDVYLATYGLHALGELATPAIPELVASAKLGLNFGCDIFGLVAIGEPALPVVKTLAHETNDSIRYGIAMCLGDFGADGKCFIPLALELLQDEEIAIRQITAQSLGDIRSEPEKVVPALLQALKDPDATVRLAAAKALDAFKPETNPVMIAALKETLTDSSHLVRNQASRVLRRAETPSLRDDPFSGP